MMNGDREVYRPKKKRHNWLLIPVILLLVLLVGFLLLFTSWQKYIVYEQGGLRLEMPWMTETESGEGTPTDTVRPQVSAELVIEGYDFSGVQTDAGQGVTALKALYVPAKDISKEGIESYVRRLEVNGANGLVLQLKPVSGQLAYQSGVEMATGYGLSGSFDLATLAADLKAQDIYLVADLSCAIDGLLTQRNETVAMKNADGSVYRDDSGVWLDLYNTSLRKYLSDLALELAGMGFDEVLLSDVAQPAVTGLLYTESMTTQPDAVSSVSSFSYYMEQAVGESIRLSLRCPNDVFRAGAGANGQDLSFLYRVYDRVYTVSDAGVYAEDLARAEGYMTEDNAARFVPMGYTAVGVSSWMLLTWQEPEN